MRKLIVILSAVIAISCSQEADLSDSVFIPDPKDAALPAYTEWGYNTFGAHYDRSTFIYTRYEIPLKVNVKDSKLIFIFQGVRGNSTSSYLGLTFTIPNVDVVNYDDLIIFNNTTINLADEGIVVEMLTDNNSQVLDVFEGELNFKRSQKVFVDDVKNEIILSGYFNLKFLLNNIPSTMTDGRFDVGVNTDNFYHLE